MSLVEMFVVNRRPVRRRLLREETTAFDRLGSDRPYRPIPALDQPRCSRPVGRGARAEGKETQVW